jgi:hypothetical protein
MSLHSAPADRPAGSSSLAYNMAGIAVLVLLAAVAAAYLIDHLGDASRAATPTLEDGNLIRQTMSGRELTIPTPWFRHGEQIRDGFTNQIDLRVMFTPGMDTAALPVDVTLVPRSRARTSASLLDHVYLHQFEDTMLSGVPGLVGKPMQPRSGYAGETVWYDALSANPFVAKCVEPVATGREAQCVRTVYLPSGIAAIYTFDAAALPAWRQFDDQMQLWLARIGAW